jgi:hypothetical protein
LRELVELPWGLILSGQPVPNFSVVGLLFRMAVATTLSMVYGLIALVPLLVAGLVAPALVMRWWWLVVILLLAPVGQIARGLVNSQFFGIRLFYLNDPQVPDPRAWLILAAGTISALLVGRRMLG